MEILGTCIVGHSIMLGPRDTSELDKPMNWDPDALTLCDWLAITGSTYRKVFYG